MASQKKNTASVNSASAPAALTTHKLRVAGKAQLNLAELEGAHLLQLSFFADQQRAVSMALKKQFGLPLPQLSASEVQDGVTAIRVEFTKIWLLSKKPFAALPESFQKFYPLEMTGSRSLIEISGEAGDALLRRLTSADLCEQPGHCFATSIHHIPVHLLKTSETTTILLTPRSYAASLGGMVADIAHQFGCLISEPKPYR